MKRALYAVLALIVVAAVVVVGVKLKEKAGENNIEIATQAEVEQQINQIKAQQPKMFKGNRGKLAEQSYRKVLAQQVRLNEMVKKEAEVRGVTVASNEVETAVAQVRRAYSSDKKFDNALKKQGLTLDQYRNNVQDQIIMSKMVNLVTKDIKITESEARAFYEENKATFKNKPYKQIVDIIKQRLLQQKQQAMFNDFIEELRKKMGN